MIVKEPEKQEVTCYDEEFITNFKSMYYLINASPDNQIKVFHGAVEIQHEEICELNRKVNRKLENHNLSLSNSSISIVFTDGSAKNFETWLEYERADWNIALRTKVINIEWDFYIKLPKYQAPQRHTLKLRIGSNVKPNEMFQLMLQEEDEMKVHVALADVVCKIDFIDPVICSEMFGLVEEWFEGLKNLNSNKLYSLVEKGARGLAYLTECIFYLTAYLVILGVFNIMIDGIEVLDASNPDVIRAGLTFISFSLFFVYLSNIAGSYVGQRVYKMANNLRSESILLITKKDKNNRESKDKIAFQLFLNVLGAGVYSGAVYIITYIIRNLS